MDRGLALLLWLSDGLAHRDIGPALPRFLLSGQLLSYRVGAILLVLVAVKKSIWLVELDRLASGRGTSTRWGEGWLGAPGLRACSPGIHMQEDLMRRLVLLLMLVLVMTLVACGGGDSASEEMADIPEGDAAAGEALFAQTLVGTQAGCITCHSLEPGITLVGPSLATIGADAGSRVSGQSAEEYLWQSIKEPNEYIAEGFSAGLMPAALADELSPQETSDLVAYLLTLK